MSTSDGRDDEAASAPRLLSRSADAGAVPSPVRGSDEVTTLHVTWAQLAGGAGSTGGSASASESLRSARGASPGSGGGVRAKVRARVVAAAGVQAAADRALIGDLIRAVDLIAARLDDVTERIGNVELLVQEVVDKLSEDLARVQVALGTLGSPERQDGDTGDDR